MAGLGLGRRVDYLAKRARALDLGNVVRIAKTASRTTWKPWPLLVVDLFWCSVKYEAGFQDYLDWDFHLLKARERRTFMTHPKSNHLALKLNSREHRDLFADKSNFDKRFGAYLGREWLDIRSSTVPEVQAFVERHGTVMVKVPDSLGGKGIEKRSAAEITDWGAFVAGLTSTRQFLVEQFLTQHERMAALNPSSVNTLRIVTFLDPQDRVHVLARALRIGNGGDVDNFSGGGMYTMVDDDGVVHHPAFDDSGASYRVHPLTGESIVGFAVPLFSELTDFVERLAREVPQIPYIGWDIAITPTGPAVIEGNYNTGVFQLKPSASGVREGLLPVYRAAIGF